MMTIEPIPIIRISYLNLFIDALNLTNGNNDMHLQHFNLPDTLSNKPDAYVPLKSVLLFMHWKVCKRNIQDLGLRAGLLLKTSDFDIELRNALLTVSSMETALQTFCSLADRELSCVHYSITKKKEMLRITCSLDSRSSPEIDHYFEWLQIMSLLTIIRQYTGNSWTPSIVSFRSQSPPGKLAQQAFIKSLLLVGQKETFIVLPASLLKLSNTKRYQSNKTAVIPACESSVTNHVTTNFPSSLRLILHAYLDTGYPSIKLAANIVGSSVRTLQRRLRYFGISYTNIVQQARLEIATSMLKKPDMKVIDAAHAVGYDDPSHFARAFRKQLGLSPQQYRILNGT